MAEQQKAQYAKPASQVDLEERLAKGNASDKVLSTAEVRRGEEVPEDGRDYRVEGNETDGYVGVSPEYATYANETEAPLQSDKGAENEVFASFSQVMADIDSTGRLAEKAVEPEAEEKKEEPAKSSTSSSTSTTK